MKTFTLNNVTYSIKQTLAHGIQYKAQYPDGTQAWVFLSGKRHSRNEIILAIDEVNSSQPIISL